VWGSKAVGFGGANVGTTVRFGLKDPSEDREAALTIKEPIVSMVATNAQVRRLRMSSRLHSVGRDQRGQSESCGDSKWEGSDRGLPLTH